ncbi:MAG: TonB-dependent receptor, partial [Prevotellaceae bacterium]|jgi:outer membrane receptor for ferrienterochelin and colicins|nr:TonB-dependent receptor [Prevotellaceae bacterium]
LETTPAFFDLGLKAAYDFNLAKTLTLQLSGGVKNLLNSFQQDFDKGADRDAGYVYGPGLPRTFYISVKIGYF